MISHEEALGLMRESIGPLGTETVAVSECGGRILAEDVVSKIDSPPFDKSAMDGHAVRKADVETLPAVLKIVGDCFAGSWPDFEIGPGECARIATGGAVPPGADAVVMVEHTEELSENTVRIEKLSGENICKKGEDISAGQAVLRSGARLTALRAGVAASAGYDRLKVRRRPTASLVCTGTEVVEPPGPTKSGKIYNSNAYILLSLLRPVCEEVNYLGIVGDDPGEVEKALGRGLKSDLLVVTGGVSVGQYDLVPDVLAKLGVKTLFHGLCIKPGKPVLCGTKGGAVVFGMPGNPFSCFSVYHVVARYAIDRMRGDPAPGAVWKTGVLTEGLRDRSGRKSFKPCRVETDAGVNRVVPVDFHGSADIAGSGAGDALFVIPCESEKLEAGDVVEFCDA